MKNSIDGGEATLEALRSLNVDYIVSSPGSEWGSLWEALARQQINAGKGPTYLSCAHETLAVMVATGYARHTGRLQAVVLHTGVGLLQGAMGIDAAQRQGAPLLILSGETLTYGEHPEFDPGFQWITGLSVVGGPQRLVEPITKWSGQITSSVTTYETIVRAGEIAQRMPSGPVYLNLPIETMIQQWTPPARMRVIQPAAIPHAPASDIEAIAKLLVEAEHPLIIAGAAGRTVESYEALFDLAQTLAIPVVEINAEVANFPKDHPLHQGYSAQPFADTADLVILVRCHTPFYRTAKRPRNATVVAIDEQPIRSNMAYQNLQADLLLEGDVAHSLRSIKDIAISKMDQARIDSRRPTLATSHDKIFRDFRAFPTSSAPGIHPGQLCEALTEILPRDTIYVDETITHRPDVLKFLGRGSPRSYYRIGGGLGQGLGLALGIKLASPDQLVTCVIGDGSFLYNPVTQSLALAQHANLPILIVVFNNGGYQAMRGEHRTYYPDGVAVAHNLYHGHPVTGLDYADLAAPHGGLGIRVESFDDLKHAIGQGAAAVREGKTAILNVTLIR